MFSIHGISKFEPCFPITILRQLIFQIDYPEIVDSVAPRHRFMAAYEQKIEPPDRKWQYLLFAAEPYETISFKVLRKNIYSIKKFIQII